MLVLRRLHEPLDPAIVKGAKGRKANGVRERGETRRVISPLAVKLRAKRSQFQVSVFRGQA